MVGLAISLVKDLNADPLIVRRQIAVAAIDQAVVAGVTEHGDDFALVVEEAPAADDAADGTARQSAADATRDVSDGIGTHRDAADREAVAAR